MKKTFEYLSKQKQNSHTEKSKPKIQLKSFAKTGKQSSPVLSEHAIQASTWEEVLYAMLNQDVGQIQDIINRISNKQIRLQFAQLNNDYDYLKIRNKNLERKVASLNDFLKKIVEYKLIKPDVKLQNDDIKQIDIESLRNVAKLTNEAKVLCTMLDTNGEEPNIDQYQLKTYTGSLKYVNKLKEMIFCSRSQHKHKVAIIEQQHFAQRFNEGQLIKYNESLRKQIDTLEQTKLQLEKDKQDLRNQMFGRADPKSKQSSKHKGLGVTSKIFISDHNKSQQQVQTKKPHSQFHNAELKQINVKLTIDIQALNEKVGSYQNEIKRLNVEIIYQKENFVKQIEKYNQETASIRKYQNSLQSKYNASANLNNQMQNLRKQLAENESSLKQFEKNKKQIDNEKESWQRTIQAEMNKSERLQNQCKVLYQNEKIHQQKITRVQQQLSRLKSKNDQLIKDREDKEIEIDNLIKQSQQLQDKIRKLQIENQRAYNQLKEVNYLKESALTKCQQYQRKKILAENKIKEQTTARYQIQEKHKEKQDKINTFSAERDNLLFKIRQLQGQSKRQRLLYKQQASTWKIHQDNAKKHLLQRQTQLTSLMHINQVQNSQNQSLKGNIEILEDQLQQKEGIIKVLRKEKVELSNKTTDLQNSSINLKEQLERLRKTIQKRQVQLSQLKNQLYFKLLQQESSGKDLKVEYEKLKTQVAVLRLEKINAKTNLDDAIKSLHRQLAYKETTVQQSKENLNRLIQEKELLRLQNEEVQSQMSKQVQTNQEQSLQISLFQSTNAQLNRDVDGLRQTNRTLNEQLNNANQQKSILSQNNISIKIQSSLKDIDIQKLKNEIGSQSMYLAQIHEKCSNLQERKKYLQMQHNDLESNASKRIEQSQSELKNLQFDYENLKKQFDQERKQNINLTLQIQLANQKLKDTEVNKNVIEKQLADMKLKTTKENYVNDSISIIQLGQSADPAVNTQNIQSFLIAEQVQRQEDLDATKKELEEFKRKITDGQARIGELQMQKELFQRQKEDKIRKLEQDIQRLSSENIGIKEQIQKVELKFKRQCQLLKIINVDLKILNDEMVEKARQSKEKFGQMMINSTQQYDRQINQLKQTITRLQSQNVELQSSKLKLDDSQGRINQIKLEKESLQTQIDLIRVAKEQIETKLHANNAKMTEQTTQFQATINEKQRLCDELKDRLRAKEQSLEAAQSQLRVKTIIIAQMNEKQAKFDEKQRSYIDIQLVRKSEDKSQHNLTARLEKVNEQLKINIQQKQSQITNIKESNQQLQKNYEQQAREHQMAKQNLERQIQSLKQKVNGVEKDLQRLKLHKESLMSTLVQKQQKNEQNKKRISHLEHQLQIGQTKITQIQYEYKQKLSQKQKYIQGLIQNHEKQIRNYEQRLREPSHRQRDNNSDQQMRIQELQEKIDKLATENTNYQNTLIVVRKQIALTQKHTVDLIGSKDIQINRLTQEVAKVNGDVKILAAKNKELDKLFEQLQTRNDELVREIAEMIEKARESQERFGDMMNYSMQEYDEKIKVLQNDNTLLKTELQRSQRERQRLQTKNKKYQQEIDDLTHQVQILNQTLEEVNKFNQSMEAKCEEKYKQADMEQLSQSIKSMRAVGEKQAEIAEMKFYMENLEEQLIKKEKSIRELELKAERLQQVYDELDFSVGQLNRLRLKEKEYQQTLSLKQGQLVILSEEKQRLKAEQEQYMKQSQEDIHILRQRLHKIQQELMLREKDQEGTLRALFQHELLQYHPTYKQFLKESIQQQCNARILKTRLIYRYDPINKANFHQYIDNLENLVVIIKLANGSYIAGFTEDSLNVDKRQTQKTGLIMSLTNRQVFKLAEQNKKAATYDQYYIIFGNSEIRIKSQEKKVYSNFGISNSYFKSRGFKVETLLGGSPKESQVDFETFEVYQLEIIYDF